MTKITLVLSAFIGLIGLTAQAAIPQRHILKIDRSFYKAHYNEIRQTTGIDIAGMNIPNATVDLIVNADGMESLRRMGLVNRLALDEVSTRSPDPKFKTPDQVAQILSAWQSRYPQISQLLSIGKSLEGRDILALRITSNIGQPDGSKPALLFNGMHHAREVMSTEVPLDIIETLLTNYGKQPTATHWVDSDVTYVIPMINPDGNNLVWTQDNMWRKNARGGYGVDINRNYPYAWNTCNGSSSDESADDFRGPSAASEPETNVMMNFVALTHPVFDISFHSYSELVIYPYGCGTHTETADVIEPLGQQMAALIPSDTGTGHYTAGLAPDLLYPVDGDDIDWMYHQAHVIPFVIELNSDRNGFQPAYDDSRDKTVASVRAAWQLLYSRLDHSTVHGTVKDKAITRVSVQGQAFRQSYPVHSDGTFHLVLNPGDYRLSFSGAKGLSVDRTIHVSGDRVDLEL